MPERSTLNFDVLRFFCSLWVFIFSMWSTEVHSPRNAYDGFSMKLAGTHSIEGLPKSKIYGTNLCPAFVKSAFTIQTWSMKYGRTRISFEKTE